MINTEKTSLMKIDSSREKDTSAEHQLKIVKELTILWIRINCDATNVTDNNLQLKLPTIKSSIQQWKRRGLTPIGRICVLKTLLVSKLVHLFMTLPDPSTQRIKELERLFFEFIWGQKNDKVKRTKMIQSYSKDGLNMLELHSFIKSMKLSWLKRMWTSNADWTIIARTELPDIEKLLTYGCTKLEFIQTKLTNPFYLNIVQAWIHYNRVY